jgi:hypothetical protein
VHSWRVNRSTTAAACLSDSSFTGKHGIREVAYASQRHPQLWLFERPGLLSAGEKEKKGLSVA